jgi:hypothetical protein
MEIHRSACRFTDAHGHNDGVMSFFGGPKRAGKDPEAAWQGGPLGFLFPTDGGD